METPHITQLFSRSSPVVSADPHLGHVLESLRLQRLLWIHQNHAVEDDAVRGSAATFAIFRASVTEIFVGQWDNPLD